MTDHPTQQSARRVTHWQLILTTWFVYSAHATIIPHLPRYYDLDLHLPDHAIGLLMALPAMLTMILQPVWGLLADRYLGRTNTYRLGVLLSLIFLLSLTLAYDIGGYWLLVLSACLMYACFMSNGPLLSSLVFSFLGQKHAAQFSRIRVAGSISFAVTMLLFCPLFVMMSEWMDWYPRTGIFLGGCVFLLFTLGSTFWNQSHFEAAERTPLKSFLALTKDKNLIVLYLSLFFVSSGISAGIQYMGPYLGHLGYSDFFYGLVWFLGIVAEVVLSFFLIGLTKWMGLKRVILIGFLADAVRWGGLYFFVEPELIIAFTLLHGVVVIAVFFASPIYLDSECDPSIRSTAQTMIYFAVLAGQINGFLTSSWIVSLFDHLPRAEAIQSGFIWFALASFTGAVICAVWMKDKPPKEPTTPHPVEEMTG